jgi:hypothetical protein
MFKLIRTNDLPAWILMQGLSEIHLVQAKLRSSIYLPVKGMS